MKNINKIISIIMASTMLFALCACNTIGVNTTESTTEEQTTITTGSEQTDATTEPEKQLVDMRTYSALLYEQGVGGGTDNNTTKYQGEKLFIYGTYKKGDIAKKEVNMFGTDFNPYYDATSISNLRKYEIDIYDTTYVDRLLSISYRNDTDKIVKYSRYAPCTDRDYKSDVNPKSTEKEFIEYARKILLENAGFSTEDWQVRVSTKIVEAKNWPDNPGDKFINQTNEDPDFQAEYTFTFYKTIAGIERIDMVNVTMSNTGEIISFNAEEYDDAYKPFLDAKIDYNNVIREAENAFARVGNYHNVISKEIGLTVIPNENELWVRAAVKFKFQWGDNVLESGVSYVIKVAELVETGRTTE